MRELVFDTETTGFSAENGDRMVEIGMVELIDKRMTGNNLHLYFNPEKTISDEVIAVHHLTNEFLSDKPKFTEMAEEILKYIGDDSVLIAHNAAFDMSFLNTELLKAGKSAIDPSRFIDTLLLSRRKYPQYSKHSLDAICRRLDISLDEREKQGHGALLDSLLLVKVYFDLTDKKELDLTGNSDKDFLQEKINLSDLYKDAVKKDFRIVLPTADEVKSHDEFLAKFKTPTIWNT
ncbi:MAG: DNA polymerase III subunit epsilon [Rickettsiales bacterium]|nr:DNA polymerase III subunit epsilon [Rickettsiales bacterium]